MFRYHCSSSTCTSIKRTRCHITFVWKNIQYFFLLFFLIFELFRLLHRDRQPIQDIPAIYFISPSLENVQRLGEDCASRLYESFYINFSSQLPQSIMEDLAAKTIRTESVNLIKSVYDQYLDFIGLEHNLFTLNVKGSLVACHHQKLTDAEAERNVELVAERLFGVLVTMVNNYFTKKKKK